MRVCPGSSSALLAILFSLPLAPVDTTEPIKLEIPQLQMNVDPDTAVVISTSEVDQLLVHVGKQPTQVTPGSIYAKLNTDAANMIMTTTTTADGILCKLDLGHREGFRLRKGRNSVEFSFTDLRQRVHYASFLLQTSDADTGMLKGKRPPITPERAGGDKYAVIVGIARYGDTSGGITSLQFADRDAQDFRSFLQSP
jgi:hypothetical protein